MNHPQIAIFARSATENTPYLRSIEGQKSLLGRTMHDIAFDEIHDEIVVTSPLTQAIMSFRGAANGEEPPLRVIQGDKTLIKGVGAVDKVSIDPVHDEIYVSTPDQRILVFDRMANGNVPPKRILEGPATQLSVGRQNTNEAVTNIGNVFGGGNGPRLRIDPIHNLLFVPSETGPQGGGNGAKILVFDRTASGNTAPKFFITTHGGGYDIYFPKLRMITHPKNDFEIWQLSETGQNEQLIAKFPAPLGKAAGATMALDPLHKEVLVATASGNSVLTFSVPELYDGATGNSTGSTAPSP